MIICVGYQADVTRGELVALKALSQATSSQPSVRYFEVHWFDSWLYGGNGEHQFFVSYSRKTHRLDAYNMENGMMAGWQPVPEKLIPALMDAGFDQKLLMSSGAGSLKP